MKPDDRPRRRSQEPAPVRRPFPRPGPAAGAWAGAADRAAHPSVTTSSSTGGSPCLHYRSNRPDRHHRVARAGEAKRRTPASVTIIDQQRIERLDEPLVPALLRLTPSAAVATSGPPARSPKCEFAARRPITPCCSSTASRSTTRHPATRRGSRLLNADLASRIEVVRGPQSALWGSDAIGGVIAVNGDRRARRLSAARPKAARSASLAPAARLRWRPTRPALQALSAGSVPRASTASLARATKTAIAICRGGCAAPGTAARQGRARRVRARTDGAQPSSTASIRSPSPTPIRSTAAAIGLRRAASGRRLGDDVTPWRGQLSALPARLVQPQLSGRASRSTAQAGPGATSAARSSAASATGAVAHTLIAAAELEARDLPRPRHGLRRPFGPGPDPPAPVADRRMARRERAGSPATSRSAATASTASRTRPVSAPSALATVGGGLSLAGSYAEGIAQPTFFDLYGFFPGSFVGNPSLKPESSRGFEASLRFRRGRSRHRSRPTSSASTTRSSTCSRRTSPRRSIDQRGSRRSGNRSGVRAGDFADRLRLIGQLRVSATRRSRPTAADGQEREVRRPKHSGSVALDGSSGRLTYGASLAYVGRAFRHESTCFRPIGSRCTSYWLADARIAYAVRPGIELFVRASERARPALPGRLRIPHRRPRRLYVGL